MRRYTAHVKPGAPFRLEREGFSAGAALFGPLWLLARRAWLPACGSFAAWGMLAACAGWLPAAWLVPCCAALAWLHGLHGRDLHRWSIARRGFRLAHVVAGRDELNAMARLLAARPDLIAGMARMNGPGAR